MLKLSYIPMLAILFVLATVAVGCDGPAGQNEPASAVGNAAQSPEDEADGPVTNSPDQTVANRPDETGLATATFAGGCFWCMEPPFEKMEGVKDVVSGYAGGEGENPTYDDYAEKGHIEVVRITYDPDKVSYEELLEVFWVQIDPTDPGGQFVDRGREYRSAIFYHNERQERLARESKQQLARTGPFDEPIVTEILPGGKFYPAEEYHQDYYKDRPVRYQFYRSRSGRDAFLDRHWDDR
jgi:peptide methionine sulfoxide reductase msrA/msrB